MLGQSIKMAWEAVLSNKLRSFLTMLGIIIGIVALVVMVSMVNGATDTITEQVESLGSDLVSITIVDDKNNPIMLDDLADIQTLDEVDLVTPISQYSAKVRHGSNEITANIYGVGAAYMDIQGMALQEGRFIRTVDLTNRSKVVVVSYDTAMDLFGRADVVGQNVLFGGMDFTIVGVQEKSEASMMTMLRGAYNLYVPYTVASRLTGNTSITSFSVTPSGSTDDAESAIRHVLTARFKNDSDAFNVINMSAISTAMDNVTSALSLLLGGVAAISLLVGGIGIMNIMLVSVTERTREIGIRKAIGAGHKSIMAQFLIEALMVSLLGCVFGLILSEILLIIVTHISGTITFNMDPQIVCLAVLFSSAVGLIFGLYPAQKAAKMHPIEALRYDG